MKKITLSAIVIASIFLSGCNSGAPVLLDAENPVELQFSAAASRSTSRSLSASDANDIVYIDLTETTDGTYTLYHKPLTDGENSLTLEKGDYFAVGLTHNPALADDSAYDYISSVGSFLISDGELDSLPFSKDAEGVLDIGNLSFNGDSYESTVDIDELSSSTGFSSTALDTFGAADTVFRNIVNPDIDHDGKYDSDAGSFWRFCTLVDINMSGIDIDFNSPSGSAQYSITRFYGAYLRYCLMLNNFNIGINAFTNWNDICFELKNYNSAGNLTATYNHDNAPYEGDWLQLYFPIESSKFISGDFTLTINEKEPVLFFKDISFIKPENNFEGFIFPQVRCIADGNGRWNTLEWQWLQIINGEYTKVADTNAIRIMIKDMYFYFVEDGISQAYSPEHFGSSYHFYENGSIDLSSYNFTTTSDGLIKVDYWDIGDNDYSFAYDVNVE